MQTVIRKYGITDVKVRTRSVRGRRTIAAFKYSNTRLPIYRAVYLLRTGDMELTSETRVRGLSDGDPERAERWRNNVFSLCIPVSGYYTLQVNDNQVQV